MNYNISLNEISVYNDYSYYFEGKYYIVSLDEETIVEELRNIISIQIDIYYFRILDLGRIMSNDEILFEIGRHSFTIQKENFYQNFK